MIAPRRKARAPLPANDDAAILAMIARGDLGALGVLYDRYAPALLRFARRLVGVQDANDIVQSAFLRVVALAHSYDTSVPSARPWLYGIVARITQEHRRSGRRWAAALLKLASQPPTAPIMIPESRRDLDSCLVKLSLAKRTVLILSEVEGFTSEEIASMLSIPVGTVWTRLHHARRELRRLYAGDDK
jgi:RNA polymerase sigma-70 factor (ECF subfamily)